MNNNTSKILIGLGVLAVGISIFKFSKKKDSSKSISKKPNNKKENDMEEFLPQDFINDVKGMSKDELKANISANKQIMADNEVGEDEKEAFESMLNFLEKEYSKR